MEEIYPDFNVFELEDDVRMIFTKLYEEVLNSNPDYVGLVASGEARGFFEALIASWEQMEAEPYYKKIWHIDEINFMSKRSLL
jgi:hypothetical protein